MPRRKILIADLLCGAGGSTTGALRAMTDLGFAASDIVVTCVNHWPTAIETHTKTDQIKQIGNAVSVAKMKACVKALMADAAPKRQTAGAPAESEEAA